MNTRRLPCAPVLAGRCALICLALLLSWADEPSRAASVVVGVIGDFGGAADNPDAAAAEAAVASLVKRWDPDLVMTTGDNNYPAGAASTIDTNIGQFYHEYISPYIGSYGAGASSNRFFPCLGNHDYLTPNAQPYFDYFTLPGNERYYRYRDGPIELFAINSDPDPDGTTSTSVQARWLQAQLAASTARWKLVYFHHPPYSGTVGGPGNPEMRWPFAAWGASLVLSGHEHVYARIFTNNLYYLINGVGGEDLEEGGSSGGAVQVRHTGEFGAVRLEATESNLVCHFITRNDLLIDTLVLGSPLWTPFILAPPLAQTVPLGSHVAFAVQAAGPGPLQYQWQFAGVDLPNATNRALLLASVQFADEGDYTVTVTSGGTSTLSRPARLTLLRQPLITHQPSGEIILGGQAATFTVNAIGAGPLRYQWLFNSANVPGATNPSLLLTNVHLPDTGDYRVGITDAIGSVLSDAAHLTVLERPVFTVQPVSQAVPVGGSVTFSISATGTLPMNFSWRRNGAIVTNILLNQGTCLWTLRNVQWNSAGNYAVGITNLAGPSRGLSSNAVLTVLADLDGDGLPDDWELAHGLHPDNAADAAEDSDGDGMSNLEEFLAGTDPNASDSRLQIDRLDPLPGGGYAIQFFAASNKTYAVEVCEQTASADWRSLVEIAATPTNRTVRITDKFADGDVHLRLYRLVTPRSR